MEILSKRGNLHFAEGTPLPQKQNRPDVHRGGIVLS